MRAQIAIYGIGFTMLLAPFFVSAATVEELQAQVQQLQAYYIQLTSQQSQSQGTIGLACPALLRTLGRGMSGNDVQQLQHFLIARGLLAGDSATGFFGALTEAAVQQFQCSEDIVCSGGAGNGHGTVGPRTRAAILAKCGGQLPGQTVIPGSKAITGWAWEGEDQDQNGSLDGGIGWVALNCASTAAGCASSGGNWGLTLAPNNTVNGYAWSSNIGWISTGFSGCPRQPCAASVGPDGKFSGWLKALAAGGGWDGWISLGDTNPFDAAPYGVTLNGTTISGFAWGGDIVGWLRFTGSTAGGLPAAPTCTIAYQCASTTHRRNICSNQVEYCGDGFYCSAGVCLPTLSAGALSVSPILVPSGQTVNVSWTATNVTSCKVTGSNGNLWTGGTTGGPNVSSPITAQTHFTLECTETASGSSKVIDTKTVNIVPIFNEN